MRDGTGNHIEKMMGFHNRGDCGERRHRKQTLLVDE